ncbi:P-loop containing nucleoside triphosphate hydrolase protein [Podospora aff. communis PSN243]|uniref:P-loop containing nucleoside triphosphate hydrolase protein n=1 Tax=Podospora aff. communis PSN243 TaxID=3040156 RepID=A0AAV9GXQ7_9PEZI|nr:P-loop containing nucleoside triphosphate hydrolase protein [Podospora aff. communis PSN243]
MSTFAQKDRREDPRKRTRIVPMEVLLLGFPRTGTSTMQSALEILGIGPVCHGPDIFLQSLDMDMALQGLEAKFLPQQATCPPFGRQEFDQLFWKYRAISDSPGCHFGPELMASYPDAKVVLVERDIDSWLQSYSGTVATVGFQRGIFYNLISLLSPIPAGRRTRVEQMLRTITRGAKSKEEVLQQICDIYREHYAEVREAAKPGQLLDYRLGDGWEPLCKFLGKPVPDVPFPHKNERAEFVEKQMAGKALMVATAKRRMFLGVMVLMGGAAVLWALS